MPCCGCCDGLFTRQWTPRKGTIATSPLQLDVAPGLQASPQGRRRFEGGREELTFEQVFAMLRPRPDLPQAPVRKDVDQSWASPVPRAKTSQAQGSDDQAVDLDLIIDEVRSKTPWAKATDEILPSVPSEGAQISVFQAEQLLASPGTLPKPMTAHEREQVIRKLLPTATFEMVSRIPRKLVEAEGLEGQTLRRRLVNGATVVWFTAGYSGKRFVFERAHALGVRSVVIEHPDSWARSLVSEGLIAKFIPLDMGRSSEVIMQEALEVIKKLGSDGVTGEADAVLTMVELSMPIVARLCEQLGLPGSPPSAVDNARDKHSTRAAVKAKGLPTPRNFLITEKALLPEAARHVGFPAVLKPISGAASLGVKKVEVASELQEVYDQVTAELASLVVVSGALAQDDGSGSGVKASKVVATHVLLEQYLDGHEVDVDIVFSEGEWRYASISDNGPTIEPWFNETWGNCPSLLPVEHQRELKELSVACVKALGFDSGVFHVECKYTSTGPQLIEVNCRMGGGPVHEINLRTWGVDLVEEAIFIALGIPSRPSVPMVPIEPIGSYLVPAEYSGVVESAPDLAAIGRAESSIVWARPMVRIGDEVVGPKDGMPTWMMDIMVTGTTAREALDTVFRIVCENPIKVGPVPR